MATASVYLPDLRYDPNETFEAFCARRQRALSEGRLAVRERRISGDLYLFYEHLVERVGANQYTWIGEAPLAETFRVDASTIKRWIARLVRAGLIRRQRQFATSSRTFITAYDRTNAPLADGMVAAEPVAAAIDRPHPEAATSDRLEDQDAEQEVVSFRRTTAPTFGADLPRDPIKRQHLTPGGGRTAAQNTGRVTAETRLLLEREGVSMFYLAPQLSETPAAELRAVSRYLDQQPNVRDRARLFAALATRGFGALLLTGKGTPPPQGSGRTKRPAPAAAGAADPLKYVSGALASIIQGSDGASRAEPAPSDQHPTNAGQCDPSGSVLHPIWQQALGSLRQVLPASEVETWFTDAALLALDDAQAIVGVPNIFAREQLTRCYQGQIAQALATARGYPVQVQIEIGSP